MSERPEHPPKTRLSLVEAIVLVIAIAVCIGAVVSVLIGRWTL